jgi:hypothetical protein
VWYRLNRGEKHRSPRHHIRPSAILVRQYRGLNKLPRFERVRTGRYCVFFVAASWRPRAGRRVLQLIAAWKKLKTLDVPKDYAFVGQARANRLSQAQQIEYLPPALQPESFK